MDNLAGPARGDTPSLAFEFERVRRVRLKVLPPKGGSYKWGSVWLPPKAGSYR